MKLSTALSPVAASPTWSAKRGTARWATRQSDHPRIGAAQQSTTHRCSPTVRHASARPNSPSRIGAARQSVTHRRGKPLREVPHCQRVLDASSSRQRKGTTQPTPPLPPPHPQALTVDGRVEWQPRHVHIVDEVRLVRPVRVRLGRPGRGDRERRRLEAPVRDGGRGAIGGEPAHCTQRSATRGWGAVA